MNRDFVYKEIVAGKNVGDIGELTLSSSVMAHGAPEHTEPILKMMFSNAVLK